MADFINARSLPDGGYEVGVIKSVENGIVEIDFDVLPAGEASDQIVLAIEKASEAKLLATADTVALEVHRDNAVRQVNQTCGLIRSRFITDLPGQQMVYMDKEIEAKAFISDPSPDIANYPHIAAEVGITAQTPYELAQLWLNMSVMWRGVSAMIENIRQSAIRDLLHALTVEEVTTILTAVMRLLSHI